MLKGQVPTAGCRSMVFCPFVWRHEASDVGTRCMHYYRLSKSWAAFLGRGYSDLPRRRSPPHIDYINWAPSGINTSYLYLLLPIEQCERGK